MSKLTICNGPDCSVTSENATREDGWMVLWSMGGGIFGNQRSFNLDFHSWQCLRAYAEREVLNEAPPQIIRQVPRPKSLSIRPPGRS